MLDVANSPRYNTNCSEKSKLQGTRWQQEIIFEFLSSLSCISLKSFIS